MKGFSRENLLFSLCGLNCGLCQMHIGGYCPGCGGGEGNQSCKIAKCSLEHGGVSYCFQCGEYPCQKYEAIDAFDSFITHRRRKADMERAQRLGLGPYSAEQREKAEILQYLLTHCNDGRRKTMFCTGVNLLELEAVRQIAAELEAAEGRLTLPEKGALAASLFRQAAERAGVDLKLHRKK